MMLDITDPKTDDKIRAALRDEDRKGRLQVVASVTGIAGGVTELRKIMKGAGELSVMDREMLGVNLNC